MCAWVCVDVDGCVWVCVDGDVGVCAGGAVWVQVWMVCLCDCVGVWRDGSVGVSDCGVYVCLGLCLPKETPGETIPEC